MDDIDSYGFDPFICHTDMVIFVAKEWSELKDRRWN
jgi:hypothetical protein